MKFVADINIAQSVIYFLRNLGHDVFDTKKGYLLAKDTEIISLAQSDKSILLTRDRDFENLVLIPKYKVPVIIFRLSDQKPDNIIRYLDELLKKYGENTLINYLIIVKDNSVDLTPLTTKR